MLVLPTTSLVFVFEYVIKGENEGNSPHNATPSSHSLLYRPRYYRRRGRSCGIMSGYVIPIVWLFGHEHHKHHEGSTYGDRKPGPPTHKLPTIHGQDSMDVTYDFETPVMTQDDLMRPVNKRAPSPIETPKPKIQDRLDVNLKFRGPGSNTRTVTYTGPSYSADYCRDFSAIQRTRLNPVTGRIIGYKGIPSKRSLSPTSKYSQFWRDQKHAKTSFHAARSPGVWDSARRP